MATKFAQTVVMASALALMATGVVAQDRSSAGARESTPFTLETDQPRTPEQEAVRFDKADLSSSVLPGEKAIRGAAASATSSRCTTGT